MGGSQSVRKITIDNNNEDVIKVSQSVVQRLKTGSRPEVQSTERKSTVDNPTEDSSNFRPPPPNYGGLPHQAYVYPAGAIPVQEEIMKEVEKTNDYWKQRVSKMESSHQEINKRMQTEFEKTMKQFEDIIPEFDPKKPTMPGDTADLDQIREQLITCYKQNKDRSLNCSAEVDRFNRCFQQKREAGHRLPV